MTIHTAVDYVCFDVSIEDGVAHIRLKRPEVMNTMIQHAVRQTHFSVYDPDH